jgi:hypothetical protein
MPSTLLTKTSPYPIDQPVVEAIALSVPDSAYSTTLLVSEGTITLPDETLALITQDSASSGAKFGVRAMLSRFFKQEFRAKVKKMLPWFISGSILAINLTIHAPIAVIGAALTALMVQVIKGIIKSNPFCQKLWAKLLAKAGMEEKDVPWIKISSIGIGSWIAAAAPSLAFLETAETMVTGLFTQAAGAGGAGGADVTTLVPLLFGVIRVVFIIYVLVALVRVVSAFRNDEDWATAARIPMIVILCVVLGDALSALIAKGSKAAGG